MFPNVQRKFRVKVNKDTHEDEISCYKLDAQRIARTEISLMKCRMKRWEDEINILKTNITTALSHPRMKHETKLKYEQRIQRDEQTNTKERDVAVKKIKDTYENEVNSGDDQFLLKYIDSDNTRGGRDNRESSTHYSRRYREKPVRNRRNHSSTY